MSPLLPSETACDRIMRFMSKSRMIQDIHKTYSEAATTSGERRVYYTKECEYVAERRSEYLAVRMWEHVAAKDSETPMFCA